MTTKVDVDDVLTKLSTVEKISLLAGASMWQTVPIPAHNIPSIRMCDGPNGVRGTQFFNAIPAACFPCGTALGATWDTSLLERAGVAMGGEAKTKGAHVILGPTINMQRSPLGGRGFESLSEDPVLAGLGAAALVKGIQSTGVVATIKHFVCNDQEHERNAVNSVITERALREIYLKPFQIVVRDSNPGAFMTAYNKVNGVHVSQDPRLLGDILRKDWGWDGCVMSDWWGTYSTTESILAGLDLEMPGPTKYRGDLLLQAVGTQKIPHHTLDERARNVLQLINRCADSGIPENGAESAANTAETAALLKEIGASSIVLMKNKGGVLPLKKDKKTLIVGPNAKIATYHGGGSASLTAYYAVTPFDGINSKLITPASYTVGSYAHKELPLLGNLLKTDRGEPGITFRAYNDPPSVLDRELADEISLVKTELLLVDYKCSNIKSELWYADLDGYLTPDSDCNYEFGLGVFGTAKLFIDGHLVVDNETVQRKGEMFFDCGTIEERGIFGMKAGQTYHLKVQFGSGPTSKLPKENVLFGGGAVRFGGAKVIDPEEEINHAVELANAAEQVIICAGLSADWESEGYDRASMNLPGHIDALIHALATRSSTPCVVVMQSGTPVAMPWINSCDALIHAWYGGNETGNAIADVLFGDTNPSGKLPLSFPRRLRDNPAYLNYRSERGRVLYGEDVYVGYRWYDTLDIEPLFAFGHGLSYTTFEFSNLSITVTAGNPTPSETSSIVTKAHTRPEPREIRTLEVSLWIQNTGPVPGAAVAQVYIVPQSPSIRRPVKELAGFHKVMLVPKQNECVLVDVDLAYAAGFWDEARGMWCVEAGMYEVLILGGEGSSVKGEFVLDETFWWDGL